jgi:hypothetical protein
MTRHEIEKTLEKMVERGHARVVGVTEGGKKRYILTEGRADATDVCGDREVIGSLRTLKAGHINCPAGAAKSFASASPTFGSTSLHFCRDSCRPL